MMLSMKFLVGAVSSMLVISGALMAAGQTRTDIEFIGPTSPGPLFSLTPPRADKPQFYRSMEAGRFTDAAKEYGK